MSARGREPTIAGSEPASAATPNYTRHVTGMVRSYVRVVVVWVGVLIALYAFQEIFS